MILCEFLEKYKTTDSKNVSHTSMTGGKWKIPSNKSKKFYKILLNELNTNNDVLPIIEKLGDTFPLIFDIDMKYNDTISQRQYNVTFLKSLVEFIWACIRDVLSISYENEHQYNTVYVMGKPNPVSCNKGTYKSKDGIHLLFPGIIIKKDVYKFLCKNINKNSQDLYDIFNLCEMPPSNLDNTLLDSSISGWQPYGCYKPNEHPYKLNYVFTLAQNNAEQKNQALIDDKDTMYTDEVIINEMSMFRPGLDITIGYTELTENQFKSNTLTSSNMVETNSCDDIYGMYYVDNNDHINKFKIVEENELKLITNLCDCFTIERASEYGKWLDVGMALHNTNSDKFYPIWEKFSQKYPRYNNGSKRNCKSKWDSFKNSNCSNPLTAGSIRYWANNDNPEMYAKIMIDSLDSQITKSISHFF